MVLDNSFEELTIDEITSVDGGRKSIGQLLTDSEEGIAMAAGAGLGAKIGAAGGPGGAAAGALIGGAIGYVAYHAFD